MGQHLVPPKVAQFFHRDSCIDDGGVSPLCKVFSNPKILSGVWALWWPIHVWKQPLVLHEVTILVALCLSTGSANLRHPRTARLSAESICCWQRQYRNDVILYYVGYSCLCCCWSISKPRRKAKLLDKQLKWNQVFKKQKYSLLLLFMLCCLSLMILFSHFSHLVPYLVPLVNQSAFDEHIDYPRLITCSWDFGRKAKEGFCRWKPINVHRPNRP